MKHSVYTALLLLVMLCCAQTAPCDSAKERAAKMTPGVRVFEILKALPTDPEAYQEPTAALVRKGIPEKYGQEEWAAVVLAHELHQHVGIMTVAGAKMAVRARELLKAPPRSVHVVVGTGPEPPHACAIDGIQAGLSSTYGQQLIQAPPVDQPSLTATFQYEGRSLKLTLRPEYQAQIQRCIQTAIKNHGNLTYDYFEAVEVFSYTVWAEFDRKTIFHEELSSRGMSDKSITDS